jgi:hypothetical protein
VRHDNRALATRHTCLMAQRGSTNRFRNPAVSNALRLLRERAPSERRETLHGCEGFRFFTHQALGSAREWPYPRVATVKSYVVAVHDAGALDARHNKSVRIDLLVSHAAREPQAGVAHGI